LGESRGWGGGGGRKRGASREVFASAFSKGGDGTPRAVKKTNWASRDKRAYAPRRGLYQERKNLKSGKG